MSKQQSQSVDDTVLAATEEVMTESTNTDSPATELAELRDQLVRAQESERRALADYHNLVRRQQQQRAQLVQQAEEEVVSVFLETLTHLELAVQQLNDTGLRMVVQQLWMKLQELGLEEIGVLGQEFDPQTMELTSHDGAGSVVVSVTRPGYRLHGRVLQTARVVLGNEVTSNTSSKIKV